MTRAQVRRIRQQYSRQREGRKLKDLAEKNGVSVATIHKAIHGTPPYDFANMKTHEKEFPE